MLKTDAVTLDARRPPGRRRLHARGRAAGGRRSPLKIACTAAGIELSNGAANVKLDAGQRVVNNGALEVI